MINLGGSKLAAADGGHEMTIMVNVIGTFLLALLLLPKLKASSRPSSRILTIVTSGVHARTNLPEWKDQNTFDALRTTSNIGPRYPTSKLLEVLVVRELAPLLTGSGVILNMLCPGLCHSELTREVRSSWRWWAYKLLLARSAEQGSRTLVAAASAGPESHGAYMQHGVVNDGALSEFVRSPEGEQAQKKVWKELAAILEEAQPGVTSVVQV